MTTFVPGDYLFLGVFITAFSLLAGYQAARQLRATRQCAERGHDWAHTDIGLQCSRCLKQPGDLYMKQRRLR